MLKKIGIGLAIALLLIQFIQIDKTIIADETYHMNTKYQIPEDVSKILKNACNNCHSNSANYPWYSYIQPVGWWLQNHINEGRQKLNFSKFTNASIARQNHKFEEIIEMVKEKEMPLPSYTYLGLHPEAKMTDAQRVTITSWAQSQMEYLATQFPPDSLLLKKRIQ
ncbi:MAG: heme-binding domain-containing protein [Saprospiraceae bacterium]|nr:heme-binding domain-containing protein [Saprospiraceae bacterium]MBK8483918.1 heme-binding domain-containing protein [Saprospiraceae bacterium]MBK9221325.1 heme-binding domain-containing protein [Saprospiraceae bacterium]MBK9721740.1 heme-binding domain-containing protein [Saprospiraceae bacterium]MBK9728801.1 heme-binding domain-containing protein [Saprospiraceae bacterium]